MTWSDPMDGLFSRGGALELGLGVSWSLWHGIEHLAGLDADAGDIHRRVDAAIDEYDDLSEDGYWDLPVHDLPVLRRHGLSDVSLMRAADDPDFAESCRVAGGYDRVAIPTFHLAGWHDVFLQGTLNNYAAMVERGREARLIVGPWTHAAFADPVGERVYGVRAARAGARFHADRDVVELQLAWLRSHVLPDATVELPEAPVRIFVMGRNRWRDESSWPPKRTTHERWFLTSGDGLAKTEPEPDAPASEFTYDPKDPVPTVGGHTVMSPGYPAGSIDQSRIEAREDVLTFTSDPLADELEVTGRVRVTLYGESSAPSTDWVARLCDVHPDGRSFNLADGILRVPEGAQDCSRYEIDLWSTSNVFLRGHRLRVHVTSSSFPRWDRNLNTGNQRESRTQLARQSVYHDAQRPSHVELPVIG
jgi:uncharacterized protein